MSAQPSLPLGLIPLRHPPYGETSPRGDVRIFPLAAPRTVERGTALVGVFAQPGLLGAKDEEARRLAYGSAYEAGPSEVVHITDARIEGHLCLAFTARGDFVFDSLRSHRQAFANGYGSHSGKGGLTLPPGRTVIDLDASALLLGAPTGGNYYHWTIEALSRGLVAQDLVPEGTKFLVQRLRAMERRTLAATGLDPDSIVEMDPETVVRVPELYVPSRGSRAGARVVPAAQAALHRLTDLWTDWHGAGTERIFISRAGARYRRIINEDAVSERLAAHGFTTLRLESLPPSEQIARFARAEMVVGMHGAGLTNLMFTKPGTKVMELQPSGLDPTRAVLYWNVAALAGASYMQVICADAPQQETVADGAGDIYVDCDHLEEALSTLFGRSS